ncbi:MAG: hypothetical protein R2932_22100 [Caldilineaceae bacterium]
MVYDPRKGDTIAERLDLKGNPNVNEDWATDVKTKEPITFVDFARAEGRFVKTLTATAIPSETIKAVAQERARELALAPDGRVAQAQERRCRPNWRWQ